MSPSSSLPTRKGCVSCGCQRVQLHLVVPPSSYDQVEMQSVMCHCSDCVGFPTTLHQASKHKVEEPVDVADRSCDAVHHLFFYNSDIMIVKGEEHIAWHVLSEDSYVKRFYAKCCLTPLGFRGSDFVTCIYGKLIRPMEENDSVQMIGDVFPPPTVAFFRRSAPKDSGPLPKGVVVHQKDLAPITIYKFWRRDVIGKKLNKRATNIPQGSIALVVNEDDMGVGWDALHAVCETKAEK